MISVPLDDFCDIVAGGRRKWTGKDFVDEGYPAFGAGGVNGYLPTAEFDRPAVVLSSIGARCGKCFMAEGEWSSLANTQLIFPDHRVADPRFLWYQLNDERRWLRSGTGQPFIKTAHIRSHRVSLPSLDEQRRTVAILDAADALRAKRREAIVKLDSFRNSLTAQELAVFTERSALGDHLEFVTSGSRGWAKYYSESGSRFVRSQDVLLGAISEESPAFVNAPNNAEAKRTVIQAGDILVTITGIVGRVAVADDALAGAFISQHVSIARPSGSICPAFAEAFMCSSDGQAQLARAQYGQTKPGLNLAQIKGFRLPVPSLADQDQLVEKISSVRSVMKTQKSSDRKLDTFFRSLQQRAFRGEL